VLVVQQAEAEGPGLLAAPLPAMGLTLSTVRAWRGERVPAAAQDFAAIVLMGGPMGVYETARHPHLADAILLAGDALRRGVPVLGVCLGSQILAAAAGARVFPGPVKEIGWHPVRLSAEGRADPLLGLLPADPVVFHWHGDTFDLPAGATLLASSGRYAHQAFRIGTRAYGLQFHVEVTPEMVDRFIAAGASEAADFGGEEGAARMRAETRRFAPAIGAAVPAMLRALLRPLAAS